MYKKTGPLMAYQDGSLGAGPLMAYKDGSLGAGPLMAYQDGSLGAIESGPLMAFQDGSLGDDNPSGIGLPLYLDTGSGPRKIDQPMHLYHGDLSGSGCLSCAGLGAASGADLDLSQPEVITQFRAFLRELPGASEVAMASGPAFDSSANKWSALDSLAWITFLEAAKVLGKIQLNTQYFNSTKVVLENKTVIDYIWPNGSGVVLAVSLSPYAQNLPGLHEKFPLLKKAYDNLVNNKVLTVSAPLFLGQLPPIQNEELKKKLGEKHNISDPYVTTRDFWWIGALGLAGAAVFGVAFYGEQKGWLK